MVFDIATGNSTAAAAVATAMAKNASAMMQKPLAPSLADLLGLAIIFLCWPLSLPSTSLYVLNYYRALKLYDAQEPNTSLALAASAAQKKGSWWKRHQKEGPKGWWFAVLVQKLDFTFAVCIYMLCMFTLTQVMDEDPRLSMWLSKLLPNLFIIALFWHMLLQPFLRLRLTKMPAAERRALQIIAFDLTFVGRYPFYLALDSLCLGSPDVCSVTVARPSTDGTQKPALCPILKVDQLDRAEFFRRIIPNALFLAPFAVILYKLRSLTGSAAFSEAAGSGLLVLAVPIVFTMAPWSLANLPMSLRGKTSLLSQCAFPYIAAAFITAILVCTDKNGSWGRAIREAMRGVTLVETSRGNAAGPTGSSEALPKETTAALLDLMNLSFPLIALLGCGAYNSLIGILMRIEAERMGLDRPTEAQIEAHQKKNDDADAHNVPTDLHGRRAVTLAEAELTKEEMRLLVDKAGVALTTAGLTFSVNCFVLRALLPRVGDMGRDDYQQRFDLARKLWRIFFLIPFVTVPLIATLAASILGGSTSVKHLWTYTERWGVDEQEKRRLKDLAKRRKMLSAASKNEPYASAVDAKEGAEVEALLVAEKA